MAGFSDPMRLARCRASDNRDAGVARVRREQRRLAEAASLYRILEKQNHLMINALIRKKLLDSSATGFAFEGF